MAALSLSSVLSSGCTGCELGRGDSEDSTPTVTDPLDRDGDGYAVEGGDCDDEDPTASPAGSDLSTDGVDQDCDGLDGVDADGDGYADAASGGDDCDDGDEEVHPGAVETAWDGVDEDCDGADLKTYVQVDIGLGHSCAVTTETEVVCWGDDRYGQSTPPSGAFEHVCVAAYHSCGIHADGGLVECWGHDPGGVNTGEKTGFPTALIATSLDCKISTTCAISAEDGSVSCWGWSGEGTMVPPEGEFESVHCEWGCCAIDPEGEAACWQTEHAEEDFFSGERWVDLGIMHDQACGVREDGEVICSRDYYGSPDHPMAEVPDVAFKRISVGTYHACGITESDALECWGVTDTATHNNIEQGQVLDAPGEGSFVYVSSVAMNSCSVDVEGVVTCWGQYGLASQPP